MLHSFLNVEGAPMKRHLTIATSLLGLLTLLTVTPDSRAEFAYVTGGNTIYQWNTTTNTVTPVVTSANQGGLDSLIFDTQGNIIYSIIGTNSIGIYNSNTHSNRILASGGNFNGVADMTLEPSGTSFLVSNAFDGSIDRVDIATGHVTTLYNGGLRPDGLAYDNSGHLFAVLNLSEVAQIDPVTGAVLKTISTPNQPDGMTFDATTGKLYVSSDGGGFYTLPTDLSSATFTSVSGSPVFDGMASDGNLLFFIVRGQRAVTYDLNTGTVTENSPGISGADDIAPVAGLGSPPTAPEPGSMVMLGSGLAILAAGAIRRKVATLHIGRSFFG
jgi:DNA-binding beta-propeller fold protein YncE